MPTRIWPRATGGDCRGPQPRSEHGLGHLVPPTPTWEDELWEWIVNTDTGHDWPEPEWFDQPALGQITINTPHDLQLFRHYNQGMAYRDQIRPGGFITIAHPHSIEQKGLLLAPFTKDPMEALQRDDWVDRATGETGLRIRTGDPEYAIKGSVAVLDYRHYAEQYMSHREWKARLAYDGQLMPRSVTPRSMIQLGKESDSLSASRPVDTSTPGGNRMDRRGCAGCGTRLSGRQSRWCSDACRKQTERGRS